MVSIRGRPASSNRDWITQTSKMQTSKILIGMNLNAKCEFPAMLARCRQRGATEVLANYMPEARSLAFAPDSRSREVEPCF